MAQMCFWQSFLIWGFGSQAWTFSQQMWYQKKQEKLFFQYMSNSMLFSAFHKKKTGRYQIVNFLLTHTV